jgi:hypothetical protein
MQNTSSKFTRNPERASLCPNISPLLTYNYNKFIPKKVVYSNDTLRIDHRQHSNVK